MRISCYQINAMKPFLARPTASRHLVKHLTQSQRPVHLQYRFMHHDATSKILTKAQGLCKSWPRAEVLDAPANIPQAKLGSIAVIPMTTNFLISHLPAPGIHNSQHFHSQKQKLRVLLLHRRPDADPLPGAWTAVSGKLERDLHLEAQWESPILAALREIREETGLQSDVLSLQAALRPFAVSAGSKEYWVWGMLWRVEVSRRDGDGDRALREVVRLNDENVDCQWVRPEQLETWEALVPGLGDTFLKLLDQVGHS